jgi:acyl carrier protein
MRVTVMSFSDLQALKAELKALIIEAAERSNDPAELDDAAPLFGPDSALGLDSLDALQISMAIQKRYGLRLTDSKETRRVLSNVDNLATYLHAWLAEQ